MKDSPFYTMKGYELADKTGITTAVEDYLEMIYRIGNDSPVRIHNIADNLHVRPSSVSKMVDNMRKLDLIDSPKYGYITLTKKGNELGEYLVYRHEMLHRFLCFINKCEDETEQVEKIEHYINARTLMNISSFLKKEEEKKCEIDQA